jgi:hypothetical protein
MRRKQFLCCGTIIPYLAPYSYGNFPDLQLASEIQVSADDADHDEY